jgi:hypothetical protein
MQGRACETRAEENIRRSPLRTLTPWEDPRRDLAEDPQNHAPPITPEKEQEIIAAREKDSHASRVARTLGDVSYATVWRVADGNTIALKAGRETMGRPRLPAEVWAKIARKVAAKPNATQKELARKIGVSRSTVGRVMGASRRRPAKLITRIFDGPAE